MGVTQAALAGGDHEQWMRRALHLASLGWAEGEVPVGAVIVRDGEVLGEGFNQPIGLCDPTAHAEVRALRDAAARIGNYRLPGATLYSTIEPCTMCAGALVHARISVLVFGARESKAGGIVSQASLLDAPYLNYRVAWQEGCLAAECGSMVSRFFAERRKLR